MEWDGEGWGGVGTSVTTQFYHLVLGSTLHMHTHMVMIAEEMSLSNSFTELTLALEFKWEREAQ